MAHPQFNRVGWIIANRYKLEEVLGHGGMSTVYRATDSNLRRTVALKVIHPHLSIDPEFVRRFEQEASTMAQLRHPNIIQVYDFNHEDDIYFMVLEYVPGETLQDRLKILNAARQRLHLTEIVQLMATICEAVAYAHERGMIHRDLKPANVMLNLQGQPILMDFGVAKMLSETHLTVTGMMIGTAKYMSPEQGRGERPDKRTDIYSLGVILYEMVAGHPPFEGDSDIAILEKHMSEPVPDIRQIHKDTPESLLAIIEKALAKEPAQRYQGADDMARFLRAVDLHPSVVDSPASTISPPSPPSAVVPAVEPAPKVRPPLWVIGSATFLILLLLGLSLSFVFSRFFQTQAEEQPLAVTTEQAITSTLQIEEQTLVATMEQTITPTPQVEEQTLIATTEQTITPTPQEETPTVSEAEVTTPTENLPSSAGMVRIDGGLYQVGRDTPSQNYVPLKQVELAEFWLDEFEVTNAQYAEFIAATGQEPPANWAAGAIPAGQEQHPVKGVTWEQADAYCKWTNKRLPTEAEWEIAARGAEDYLFPWGDDQNTVKLPQSGTYEVGSVAANRSPFGAYDMAGNVWEWVGDTYAPVAANHRVLRGGENGFLKDMAYRLSGPPDQESIVKTAGIRCAADQVEIVSGTDVLYEELFVDTSGNWPEEDVEGGPYRIGYHPPDFYHVEIRAPEEHLAVPYGEEYDDVTVEMAVLVDHTESEQGDFRYGLILRQSGEDQYYVFTVDPRAESWQVLKQTPAGLEELATDETPLLQGIAPAGVTPDKTDKLRVDAQGSNFVFSINNQVVGQVSDSTYTSGKIGFYGETFDETLVHLHYDSLIVREVEMSTFEPLATPVVPPPTAPQGTAFIPAGYFNMGSSTGQANEKPEHPVFLDAFYLDLNEVTHAHYRECVKEQACTPGRPSSATRQDYQDNPAFDHYPVVGVTWDQANAYCKWVGKHLPTEAQWEYAASGPDNFTWPWGNTFEASLLPATETDTQPVGSYPKGASPFGVFDMAGNVAEWVADDYDETFYANSPSSNPYNTNVSAGRIFRGGSFGQPRGALYTTSRRDGNLHTYSDVQVGFRCAQDAPEVTPPDERAALVAQFCELYAEYKPEAVCP